MGMISSLRARLAIVVVGVTLFMAGVIVGLVAVISDVTRTAGDLERLASRIALTDRLLLELGGLLSPLNDYLLTEDESRRDAFDRSISELSGLLSELQRDQTDAQWGALARDISERVTHLGTLAVEVLFVEHPVGDPQVVRVMNTVNRLADEVTANASRFRELADTELSERKQRAAEQSARVRRVVVALAVAVPTTLGVVYLLTFRWLLIPLGSLVRGVAAVKSGRATRLPVRSETEISEIATTFNDLVERLTVSQDAAQGLTRQVEVLEAAGRSFGVESSRSQVYQSLTDMACSVTDARYGVLAVVNDQDQLVQLIESGVSPVARLAPDEQEAFIAALPAGNRPLRMDSSEQDARLQDLPGAATVRTLLSVPVFVETGARSCLYLCDKPSGAFSPADEDLVVKITHDAVQSLRVISLREETERLATIDNLTGFINRWALEDRLTDEFLRAARHGHPFALIFIDVDDLKAINQKGGHPAGDAAIRRFCDAIRSVIRTTDVAGRYGGDEILVLLPETTLKDAMAAANRILRRVASLPLTVAHERLVLSASLGVAAYPEHGRDKESLLRAADFALYQAKATGRGRVHAVKPSEGDAANIPKAA
jgi:diguanylate cyclase (GGDEF)-like protein